MREKSDIHIQIEESEKIMLNRVDTNLLVYLLMSLSILSSVLFSCVICTLRVNAECSTSQNSVSVIFRGFLKFASKICPRYLNHASIKSIYPSVIFRGYLNSASVILIYPRNYRGFRPLCYTLCSFYF